MATKNKIKVLFVAGMYPNPSFPQKGVFCHEQVKALKILGVDVDVVVPYTFYDKVIKTETWVFEGVKIRYISYFKVPGTFRFEKTGYALFRALDKKIDLKAYDVYHADAALPTGQAMMLASKKYNIPYVVHGHGLDVFLDVSYKEKKNCKKIADESVKIYKNSNAVIGVSQKVINNVLKKADINEKAYVAYNGVDVSLFRPYEHTNKKIIISSIGNLIPLKGHKYLLEAVAMFNEKFPDEVLLRVAGKGYLEEELKKLADQLNISEIVSFIGYIPYEKVIDEMRNSDIFILPSYYEALGCVYLEAMACGIPVVGCKNNGIDEIIENKHDGYLVDEKDAKQLLDILELLRDENIRKSIGENARRKAEQYTWIHSAESVKRVYENIV